MRYDEARRKKDRIVGCMDDEQDKMMKGLGQP
jgi:hypothetical protein